MFKKIIRPNLILVKVLPFVAAVLIVKYCLHLAGLEFLTLNAIYSGIIGANIFLLGFLLSGVLADFKESEKLPGEIATLLHVYIDELTTVRRKHKKQSDDGLENVRSLTLEIRGWLYRKVAYGDMMKSVRKLNVLTEKMEKCTHLAFVQRLKTVQGDLRRVLIRIHTIRETNFISSGYLIAVSTSILLILAMVASRLEPFHESLFLVGVISYLIIFLLFLIRDLDNPFAYNEKTSSEDVSLHPIEDLIRDLEEIRLDSGKKFYTAEKIPKLK